VTAANVCCVCFARVGEQRFQKTVERKGAAAGAIVCDVCWPAEFYVAKKNAGEAGVWEGRDRVERPEDWVKFDQEAKAQKLQRTSSREMEEQARAEAGTIGPFQGEWRWLSNFWPCEVVLDGVTYPSTEHAYQAAKLMDPELRERVRWEVRPNDAKRLARSVPARTGWEEMKVGVMLDLLRQKFRHPKLRAKLLATGDCPIVELNWWKDFFWGVCDGVGQNMLGKLLMQVRDEARREEEANEKQG